MRKLYISGVPRKLRIYDNGGKTMDRYTVVFTGSYQRRIFSSPQRERCYWVLGMNGAPFHPQGFCQHMEYETIIDRPKYGHLGKKIKFQDLPEDCRKVVLKDYDFLWDTRKEEKQ